MSITLEDFVFLSFVFVAFMALISGAMIAVAKYGQIEVRPKEIIIASFVAGVIWFMMLLAFLYT